MLYRCCVCRRYQINGEWVRLRYEEKLRIASLKNTYCPDCARKLIQEIRDALRRERDRDQKVLAFN